MQTQTDTPIYDQLAAESDWTPAQLRPRYDIEAALAESYMHQIRRNMRAVVARRVVKSRKRAQRRGRLP